MVTILPLCCDFVWLEFVQIFCVLSQSVIHMCICTFVSRKHRFLEVIHHFWLFLPPLPHRSLMLWGGSCHIGIPFKTEHFKVSFTLCMMSSCGLLTARRSFSVEGWVMHLCMDLAICHQESLCCYVHLAEKMVGVPEGPWPIRIFRVMWISVCCLC